MLESGSRGRPLIRPYKDEEGNGTEDKKKKRKKEKKKKKKEKETEKERNKGKDEDKEEKNSFETGTEERVLFDCKFCKMKFRHYALARNHEKYVHSQLRPFSCSYCTKKFKRNQHAKRHEEKTCQIRLKSGENI